MAILIGGSPSTGSSMLRRVLDRHSHIFCGSETSIFSKEELYLDWSKYKSKLTAGSLNGLLNAGWHHYRSIDIEPEYMLSKNDFIKVINNSKSMAEFSHQFYAKALDHHAKTIWAEKTPSNAFTLKLFLDHIPDSKVIHITRHPLDCIGSLVNRGMDVYNAIAVYLLNTTKALKLKDVDRAYLIKYEDLTQRPKSSLTSLMDFLGLTLESTMLDADDQPKGVISMKGWQHNETDAIKPDSIGRFYKLSSENQSLILSGLKLISCNIDGTKSNISDIISQLNYDLPELIAGEDAISYFRKAIKKDKLSRQLKRAYFRGGNYPIALRE